METLPQLALKEIVQHLRPADLACCSAVCRKWRTVFNQDWIWRPHSSFRHPSPEEFIPSNLTPAFVAPDESTLAPLCHWRLETCEKKELCQNLEVINYKEILKIEDKNLFGVDFLTDNLVVVWYADHVEIFDVSVSIIPPVSWPKSDTTISIEKKDKLIVSGPLLIILKDFLTEVYNVDLTNKTIQLKHCIFMQSANDAPVKKYVVKEHSCMFTYEKGSNKMNIYDLNTGKILKEEAFPMEISQCESFRVRRIQSSSTSDFIAVSFTCKENANASLLLKLSVYDTKKLNFLPDVMFNLSLPDTVALHHQWLAYNDRNTMAVYDMESKNVLFRGRGGEELIELFVSENDFLGIFRIRKNVQSVEHFKLKRFSPLHKTMYTMTKLTRNSVHYFMLYLMGGNKLFHIPTDVLFGLRYNELKIVKINQSCTKMLVGRVEQVMIKSW